MTLTLLEAAEVTSLAARAHVADGCTTCRPGARLAELCPDGQRVVTEAATGQFPGLLEPETDAVLPAPPLPSPDPAPYPDNVTDEYVLRTARRLLPALLALTERLAARVEELEARGCRCYDPTAHAPGCLKAVVHWQGRTYPAAVWYRDGEGYWWAPTGVDARGCLFLQLNADPANEPAPLDAVAEDYPPLTATAYGSHVPRADLPGPAA